MSKTIIVPKNANMFYKVSKVGYKSVTSNVVMDSDKVINVSLELNLMTFTINPTPSDAVVTLTATGYTQSGNSITVVPGTTVNYSVSKEGYTTVASNIVIESDKVINVELEEEVQQVQIYAWGMESYVNNENPYNDSNIILYTITDTPSYGDVAWIKDSTIEPPTTSTELFDYKTTEFNESISQQYDIMYTDNKIYYATNNASAMTGGTSFVRIPSHDKYYNADEDTFVKWYGWKREGSSWIAYSSTTNPQTNDNVLLGSENETSQFFRLNSFTRTLGGQNTEEYIYLPYATSDDDFRWFRDESLDVIVPKPKTNIKLITEDLACSDNWAIYLNDNLVKSGKLSSLYIRDNILLDGLKIGDDIKLVFDTDYHVDLEIEYGNDNYNGLYNAISSWESSSPFDNYKQSITLNIDDRFNTIYGNEYIRGYIPTYIGITYYDRMCLSADTLIMLADGTQKTFKDLTIDDEVMVWDFDEGKLTSSKLLWLQDVLISPSYCEVKTDTGKKLKCIGPKGHRVYSYEDNRFEYVKDMVGKQIWTRDGIETIISCSVINEDIEYRNAITFKHINLITNDILTSCRYNNMYPIENMKFVKDTIINNNVDDLKIEDVIKEGMRLSEQPFTHEEMIDYINRLKENGEINTNIK